MGKIIRVIQDNKPHCPVCSYKLDMHSATDKEGGLPRNGDASICFNCVTLLVFEINENGYNLRIPTQKEQKVFDADEDIVRIVQLIKQSKIAHNRLN